MPGQTRRNLRIVLSDQSDADAGPRLVENRCGFIGSAVLGPHYIGDQRPQQEAIELWDGRVEPERIQPGGPEWSRASLHFAANVHHIARQLHLDWHGTQTYRVAWVAPDAFLRRREHPPEAVLIREDRVP